jgi:hypothetical protein
VSKGTRFWGFRCSRVRGALGGISLIPLDLASFGGQNLGYGVPMRCSYYPKVLCKSVERFRRSGVGFGGVDPRVMFIPTSSGHTGLTGATHRSDRCGLLLSFARVNVWVSSLLSRVAAISSLGQFGAR